MNDPCPTDDELSALADGALNEEQAAQLRQHCASCDKCHKALEAVQNSSLVRELPATLVPAPPSMTTAVMDALLVPSRPSQIVGQGENDTSIDVEPVTGGLSYVGRVLKHDYRLERELGKGAMGQVYLASHVRLPDRWFAVKILSAQTEHFERFRQEAQITSRLQHPNIVRVSDYAQMKDGTAFLVMDYLDGENLGQRLKRVGRLSLAETLKLARALGSGLQAAHAAKVIHRDLKPENVMLAQQSQGGVVVETPVIVDFGISKIRDTSESFTTDSGRLIGTPCYMSPEQARGDNGILDEQTDQFALGAILYECLAGQRAFPGTGVVQLLAQVQHHQPTALRKLAPQVPRYVERAILRALNKKREERFASIEAFLDALDHPPSRLREASAALGRFAARPMLWLCVCAALALWRFASVAVEGSAGPSLGAVGSGGAPALLAGSSDGGAPQRSLDGAVDRVGPPRPIATEGDEVAVPPGLTDLGGRARQKPVRRQVKPKVRPSLKDRAIEEF